MAHLSEILSFLGEEGISLASPLAPDLVREKFLLDEDRMVALFGHGPVEPFFKDASVTEILVNGFETIFVEREGKMECSGVSFLGDDWLRLWVKRILSEQGRRIDQASPFADATLADGSRVHIAFPPIAKKGVCVSIRKSSPGGWTLEKLAQNGNYSPRHLTFLREALRQRRNIFISGGTGSGKTSLLAALLSECSPAERIIALEDIAELKPNHPHFLSLESRSANQEGRGEIPIHRLLREALRMRPDRLVIGECRGVEALDVLMALNTGHSGSMGTIHANSPRDALRRLETLALLKSENLSETALRNLILGAVNVVVQLSRENGRREICSLVEVKGFDAGNLLLKEIAF